MSHTRSSPSPAGSRVMIIGTHAIVYAEDADRARGFLRDVLGLPNVDAGDGWLIFRLPPAEVGVHPVGAPDAAGTRSISCATTSPRRSRSWRPRARSSSATSATEASA